MNEPYAAVLRGVTKQYKPRSNAKKSAAKAAYTEPFTLGPIELTIPAGSIVGLIGENGAGKTTLLQLLCGGLTPDAGEITLLGRTPDDAAARAGVGVVFEEGFFFPGLNLAQVGRSMAGVFGAAWDAAAYAELLHRFALDPQQKIQEFSRGMRMKARLAAALAHHPDLLVLDEATSGLDPVARGELLDLLLDFLQEEQHSVIFSSHITADLEQVADSIAYLHGGKLLFHTEKDDLMQHYGVLRCPAERLAALPQDIVVHTRQSAFGAETLVKDRTAALAALPQAVCDAAKLDDIMRFTSGRDAQ